MRLVITCNSATYAGGKVRALGPFEITAAGGLNVLMGASGTGKTTLLNSILGFHQEFDGQVALDQAPLSQAAPGTLAYVQQGGLDLLPWRSAIRNVTLGAELLGLSPTPATVAAALETMGLCATAMPSLQNLAGGERARVAIARALLTQPRVLLLDEPCAALDQKRRLEVYDCLRRLGRSIIVLVTMHDIEDAVYCANEVFVLKRPNKSSPSVCERIPKFRQEGSAPLNRNSADFWSRVQELEHELSA